MNTVEKLSAHIIFFFIFLLSWINIGFFLGYTIQPYTLPAAYYTYSLLAIGVSILFRQKYKIHGFFLLIAIPLLFVVSSYYFGRTYDTSFDGRDYHSGGVLELVKGWNPITQDELPITLPDANYYVKGYPKSLWEIQASIYSLTDRINTGPITNLFILIPSFTLAYGALRRLKVMRLWGVILATFLVLEVNFLQQFFTYMADGFSYQLGLIALAGIIAVRADKNKILPLGLLSASIILLVGTKFSNLAFCLVLSVLSLTLIPAILKRLKNIAIVLLFVSIGVLLLWAPYATNYQRYGHPLQPSNTIFAQADVVEQNVPNNLTDKNRFTLLFYGIFSKTQVASETTAEKNIAELRIPFLPSIQEILITNNYNNRVGGAGPLFSGILTISAALYLLSLILFKDVFGTFRRFAYTTGVITLIVASTILIPTPNVIRFIAYIQIIPFIIIILFITSHSYHKYSFIRISLKIMLIIFAVNCLLKLLPTMYARDKEMKAMDYKFNQMQDSGKIHYVTSDYFYSTYLLLEEKNIEYQIVEKLPCQDPQNLWYLFLTYYCVEK